MLGLVWGMVAIMASDMQHRRHSVIGTLPGPCETAGRPFVGMRYDQANAARLARTVNMRSVRVVRVGDMVTQDFVEDRLTVVIDRSEKIVAVYCG